MALVLQLSDTPDMRAALDYIDEVVCPDEQDNAASVNDQARKQAWIEIRSAIHRAYDAAAKEEA